MDAQESLFGEGRMLAPQKSTTPDPETIRARLRGLLKKLENAETMPLSDRDVRMWQTIVPNMTRWLPDAEAKVIRMDFAREMDRLNADA